jgi:hypothetical protein
MTNEPITPDDLGHTSSAYQLAEVIAWLIGDGPLSHENSGIRALGVALYYGRVDPVGIAKRNGADGLAKVKARAREFGRLFGEPIRQRAAAGTDRKEQERLNADVDKLYRSIEYQNRKPGA